MSPRRGFTLLEVLLVMAVIVMLAAMAYPSIEAMYSDVRLKAAADQVRAAWADARTKAIEEGRPYRFAVQPDGQFRIAPDAADFWTGGGGTPAPTDADTQPLVVEDTLPKGVNFADGGVNGGATDPTAGDSGPWQAVVRFLPDGTASQDVEIVFQAEGGGRPVSLRLRGLTGSVTMPAQPAGRQP
jgi:prepilin-type N-terminal cleavage/methylation domain-containing protein